MLTSPPIIFASRTTGSFAHESDTYSTSFRWRGGGGVRGRGSNENCVIFITFSGETAPQRTRRRGKWGAGGRKKLIFKLLCKTGAGMGDSKNDGCFSETPLHAPRAHLSTDISTTTAASLSCQTPPGNSKPSLQHVQSNSNSFGRKKKTRFLLDLTGGHHEPNHSIHGLLQHQHQHQHQHLQKPHTHR